MCCGEPMEEIIANTSDGAAEKHVPVYEVRDGKLFVYNVENVVRIRTGEEGYAALVNEIEPAVAK